MDYENHSFSELLAEMRLITEEASRNIGHFTEIFDERIRALRVDELRSLKPINAELERREKKINAELTEAKLECSRNN